MLLVGNVAARLDVDIDGDGVVAGRDANIDGGVVFGLKAREIEQLVQAQLRLERTHAEEIGTIAQRLGVAACDAVQLLRDLAQERLTAAAARERVAALRAEQPRAAADSIDDSAAAVSAGEATASVRLGRGIVALRDIDIAGDVVFGVSRSEVEPVLATLRAEGAERLAQLNTLSLDLSVSRCATGNFLATLGEQAVPIEDLHGRLQQIARQHLTLVAQWESISIEDPEITSLRDAAKTAIDRGDHPTAERLLADARRKMGEKISQVKALATDFASVEGDIGRLALIALRYDDAAEAFANASDYAAKADEPKRALDYLELAAAAYQDAGRYDEAESAFREVLAGLGTPQNDADSFRFAVVQNNYATLQYARSEYYDAAEQFQAALATLDGADEPLPAQSFAQQRAVAQNGLGDAATALGDFDAAETHYNDALATMEAGFGDQDHRLRSVLSNLARLRAHRGDFAGARGLFERARNLEAPAHARADPERAAVSSEIAALHYAEGDLEAAMRLWRDAIGIYVDTLGCEHVISLGVLLNLATAQRRAGDLAQAEALYLLALDAWADKVNIGVEDNHLLIASVHDNLGDVYVATDWLDEAEVQYETALDIIDARFNRRERKTHPLIASLNQDLGVLYERRGELEDAADAFTEAREIFALKFGESHRTYGIVTSNLARVKRRLGRLDEAVALYREAIGVAADAGDVDKAAYRRGALARVYMEQGSTAEARRELETAQRLYADHLGPDHPKTAAISARLAGLDAASDD
jgi:tetratricopeptide (TPR) repeat protein